MSNRLIDRLKMADPVKRNIYLLLVTAVVTLLTVFAVLYLNFWFTAKIEQRMHDYHERSLIALAKIDQGVHAVQSMAFRKRFEQQKSGDGSNLSQLRNLAGNPERRGQFEYGNTLARISELAGEIKAIQEEYRDPRVAIALANLDQKLRTLSTITYDGLIENRSDDRTVVFLDALFISVRQLEILHTQSVDRLKNEYASRNSKDLVQIPLILLLVSLAGGLFVRQLINLVNKTLERRRIAEHQLKTLNEELERRIAERTSDLEASQQKILDYAESAVDRFWELDENLRYTYISPMSGRISTTPDEIVGRNILERFKTSGVEDDKYRLIEEILDSRQPFRGLMFTFSQGRPAPLHVALSGKPIFDANGKFTGYRGTVSNMTEKVKAEERARGIEQEFVNALENLGSGYSLWDSDGMFVACNSAFRNSHKGSEAALSAGHSHADYVRAQAPHRPKVGPYAEDSDEEWIESRLSDPRKTSRESTVLRDGRWYFHKRIHMADNSIAAFETDVTDLKRTEDQLRQAQKMDSLGNLAGGVAHTLNNLLLPILALGTLELGRSEAGSPTHKSLERIVQAGDSAKREVERILAFSRQEESRKEQLDIRTAVKSSLELLRAGLPATIDLKEILAPDVGTVLADPLQMETVLMNLVTNAAAAMNGAVGEVAVTLDKVRFDDGEAAKNPELSPGSYGRLTVSDNGLGMAPGTIERIFDPYFTTKDVGQGTGLGLSIVHGIVRQHEGSISVTSEVGIGSRFEVYLPLIKAQPRESARA